MTRSRSYSAIGVCLLVSCIAACGTRTGSDDGVGDIRDSDSSSGADREDPPGAGSGGAVSQATGATSGGEPDAASDADADAGARDSGAAAAGGDGLDGGTDGGADRTDASTHAGEQGADAREPLLARGRRVFMRVCARCHSPGAESRGPHLAGKRIPAAQLVEQVRQGSGRMSPIPPSELPARDMKPLLAFLRAHGVVRGAGGR